MLLFSRSKLMLIALLVLALICTFVISMLTTHSLHTSPAGLINICGSCRRGNYLFCTSSAYYNQYYILMIKMASLCPIAWALGRGTYLCLDHSTPTAQP